MRTTGRNSNRGRDSNAAGIDSLEPRRLLAAVLDGSALLVEGTDDDDVITLRVEGTEIVVEINYSAQTFPLGAVGSIVVQGLAGNDYMSLGQGVPDARMSGGPGNDTLVSGPGDDTLAGDAGDDTYVFADDWGDDIIVEWGAGGIDTMDFSAVTSNLLFALGALSVSDGRNVANHGESEIENLIGGSGDDTFFFHDSRQLGLIDGRGGNNSLIYTDYNGPAVVNLATGQASGTTAIASIANVFGSRYDDSISGDAGANILDGGPGNDTIAPGGGADVIVFSADSGSDTLVQDALAPAPLDFSAVTVPLTILVSQDGVSIRSGQTVLAATPLNTPRITGGAGNDTVMFSRGAVFAGVLDGGGGANTLDYRAFTTGVRVRLDAGTATATAGIARFINALGGAGNDVLVGDGAGNRLYGYGGNDTIYGNSGNDILKGGTGNDVLKGGNGDDKLYGDQGNDKLYGGAGNDSLTGGAGGDLLSGDAGNDTLLARDRGVDTVKGGTGKDKALADRNKDLLAAVETILYS